MTINLPNASLSVVLWLGRHRITGKARGGCEKPVRNLYRGREGQDQDVAEDSRTGAGRGMYVQLSKSADPCRVNVPH